jgi:hypothetical protein
LIVALKRARSLSLMTWGQVDFQDYYGKGSLTNVRYYGGLLNQKKLLAFLEALARPIECEQSESSSRLRRGQNACGLFDLLF